MQVYSSVRAEQCFDGTLQHYELKYLSFMWTFALQFPYFTSVTVYQLVTIPYPQILQFSFSPHACVHGHVTADGPNYNLVSSFCSR
eukprot:m.86176 g.86176  ORF g.86176 m.86176 type:complete len:86 (-) comp12799_c0_seq3:3441-3698(-)